MTRHHHHHCSLAIANFSTGLKKLAFGLAAAFFLAACDEGKSPVQPGPGPGDDTVFALAGIKSQNANGMGDTTIYATYTYDTDGMLVRERSGFRIFEWDSLGRYIRWTQHNHRDTSEISEWVTSDSSVRGSAHSTLKIRERWFGLRPNCRCADSLYRYLFGGPLQYVRRFTYDSLGNLTLVTRDYASPARRDTALRYENHYAAGRLAWRISFDNEAEDTTRQIFVYAPLDSLLEAR